MVYLDGAWTASPPARESFIYLVFPCRGPITVPLRPNLQPPGQSRGPCAFSRRLRGPFVLPRLAPDSTLPGSLGPARSLLIPFSAFRFYRCVRSIEPASQRCQGRELTHKRLMMVSGSIQSRPAGTQWPSQTYADRTSLILRRPSPEGHCDSMPSAIGKSAGSPSAGITLPAPMPCR